MKIAEQAAIDARQAAVKLLTSGVLDLMNYDPTDPINVQSIQTKEAKYEKAR